MCFLKSLSSSWSSAVNRSANCNIRDPLTLHSTPTPITGCRLLINSEYIRTPACYRASQLWLGLSWQGMGIRHTSHSNHLLPAEYKARPKKTSSFQQVHNESITAEHHWRNRQRVKDHAYHNTYTSYITLSLGSLQEIHFIWLKKWLILVWFDILRGV